MESEWYTLGLQCSDCGLAYGVMSSLIPATPLACLLSIHNSGDMLVPQNERLRMRLASTSITDFAESTFKVLKVGITL